MGKTIKILLDDKEILVTILFSGRKSISAEAAGHNHLLVRSSSLISENEIAVFLSKRQNSIFRLLHEYDTRLALREAALTEGIYVYGNKVRVQTAAQKGIAPRSGRAEILPDRIKVFSPEPENEELTKSIIINALGKYMMPACRELNEKVYKTFCTAGFRVPYAKVTLKNMSSRWGSCSAVGGKISINIKLIHFPPKCLESVFYHEYAHFVYQNHSNNFYSVLHMLYPDYDKQHTFLKNNAALYCGWY